MGVNQSWESHSHQVHILRNSKFSLKKIYFLLSLKRYLLFPLDGAWHVDHEGCGHVHHCTGCGDQVLKLHVQRLLRNIWEKGHTSPQDSTNLEKCLSYLFRIVRPTRTRPQWLFNQISLLGFAPKVDNLRDKFMDTWHVPRCFWRYYRKAHEE